MLTSTDDVPVSMEPFKGTAGLGVGPSVIDWNTLSGSKKPTLDTLNTKSRRVRTFDRLPPQLYPENLEADDNSFKRNDTDAMNDITRGEITQALSAIEERMDKRMDRADQQADRRAQDIKDELALRDASFRTEQSLRDKAADERFQSFLAVQAERDKRMEQSFNSIQANNTEIKDGIKSMKNTVIVTAVSAVLAIVIGVASFNATLTSNMISSFQLGKSEQPGATPTAPAPAPAPAK